MQTICTFLILSASIVLSVTPAYSDGLIAQPPDNGEYIVYEMVAVPVGEEDDDPQPEMQGTMRLSCVGVEEIDGVTSRWIEVDLRLSEGGNQELRIIYKLLMPDVGVEDADAYLPFTRGWAQLGEGEEPSELSPERISIQYPGYMFLSTAVKSPAELTASEAEKTITIAGEEHTLTVAQSGEFEKLTERADETLSMSLSGEGTWWSHEDQTFVGAAEVFSTMTLHPTDAPEESTATKGIALQLNAIEVGSDAVSALPESN
jgi:hypothetical protein